MRLKIAFGVLRPKSATYQALDNAHTRFRETYRDNADLLKVGQAARECLIEKDVYWLCPEDFERYAQEATTINILAEYQRRLTAVRAMTGVVVSMRGSWIWVSGSTEPYEDELQALKFIWRCRKRAWTWHPGTLN